MKIQIFSMMAAIVGTEHGAQWEGEFYVEWVDQNGSACDECIAREQYDEGLCVEAGHKEPTVEQINERIFRLFNRIDPGDDARLTALGYFLPSLSVGDFVTWGYPPITYAVAPIGFQTVTGNENQAARLIMEAHGFDKG